MSNSNTALYVPPSASSQTVVPESAKASAIAQTPSGTLSITLAPAPTPSVPLYENVSLWAGVITFLGVVLTLIAAERRTRKELRASEDRMRLERQFSGERAHQERITTARRTVYLDLIDQLIKMQKFLGSLASTKEEPDFNEGLDGLTSAVSKICLVGEMGTIVLAREMLLSVNKSASQAAVLHIQATMQRRIKDTYSEECDTAKATVKRLAAEIAEYKKGDENDKETLQNLERDLNEASAALTRHRSNLAKAVQALTEMQMSYAKVTTAQSNRLSEKLDDLIHAIRTELGLETSLEQLQKTTADQRVQSEETTEKLTKLSTTLVKVLTKVEEPSSAASTETN